MKNMTPVIDKTSDICIDETVASAVEAYRRENPLWASLDLRVYLAGKGCDGFEYGVCFDTKSDGDLTKQYDSFAIVCDKDTYEFVSGSTISFVDDERGKGFLVANPNHKKFRGKFFKRSEWSGRTPSSLS